MDCYNLNVFRKDAGHVWQNRTRINTTRRPVLSVSNKCNCYEANACKGARFVHAALDHSGKRMVSGDRHGHVYLFHLEQNRFWLVTKLGSCCTAITFSPLEERDLLVASSDCSLHIFETGRRKHIAHLGNHASCISHISVDKEGHYFLTCSLKTTLVWDLLTLTVLHELNFQLEENLIKSIFIPPGATFLTALKEDRVLLWNTATFECFQQLKIISDFAVRTLDVSSDGCLVAAGGRASWLLIWALNNNTEEEQPTILSMAGANVESVKQVSFFPASTLDKGASHILGVLCHEGLLHFYETETGVHLLKLGLSKDNIFSFNTATLADSWRFIALTFSGKLLLYDLALMFKTTDKGQPEELVVEDCHIPENPQRMEKEISQPNHLLLNATTVAKLKGIVKEFGHYPDKYRYIIWKNILNLPNNESAFRRLLSEPLPTAFKSLGQTYHFANTTIFRALQRILGCLCNWCPQLTGVSDLPLLVFPFVKLFHQNLILCFEIVLIFICNWCRNWFAYYPNPPFNIMAATECVLSFHDPTLLLHFIRNGITAEIYVWSLLKTVFSEVISKEMWLHLFDHIISNQPAFLLYTIVAFNILSKKQLMKLSSKHEFKSFYQKQQAVSIRDLVRHAYLIQKNTPLNTRESCVTAIGEFTAQTALHTYPSFNNFPNIQVDTTEENKLIQEEMDYERKRQDMLLNMHADERVKICKCATSFPGIIRSTTCACVLNPHGFNIFSGLSNSSAKENIRPSKKKIVPGPNFILEEEQESPVTVKELNDNQITTEVIRRVLTTRKKLTQPK